MREIWKQIPNFPLYEVSTLGRVRHIKHKKIRKPKVRWDGYHQLHLAHISGKKQTARIHKLVASAFLADSEGAIIDHINRDRTDNRLKNLRVATSSLNNRNRAKPSEAIVRQTIRLYQQGYSVEEIIKVLMD